MKTRAVALFQALQSEIVTALETLEPTARFRSDHWTRPGGGGGHTRVLEGGEVWEKAGVNFSEVHGELPAAFAAELPGEGTAFWACGVSLVIHPRNPWVPTTHANYRMICKGDACWFGGGADLTPYYPFEDDAQHFHRTLKAACDAHDPGFYPKFKPWCDEYFYIPHRKEHRGLGGIFYDRLTPESTGHSLDALFAFQQDSGRAFIDAYLPIAQKHAATPYGDAERAWQSVRRGRYVEFNLMYDRGTIFGLKTNGRIESILMSLPPSTGWRYDHHPATGTPEAQLVQWVTTPRDWV